MIIGCDEDNGTVNLNFAAMYDGDPLVMNEVVDYDGSAMRINVSEFYVSEITLSGESGNLTLGETEYVKFTGQTGDARATLSFDVPPGSYDQLSFFIGVPADKNVTKPEDYSSDEALANTATYWQGWQSYIFNKLEGRLDTAGFGSTDLTFIYHSGKDELYTEVVVPLSSAIAVDGNSNNIEIDVEHNDLFKREGGGYLDIAAKPSAHNPDDLEYPTVILNNFKTGVTIR